VQPGARFCPQCGRPLPASPAPEPAPTVTASTDPPQQPTPPRWPWEINEDDELHAVQSDPTVVPPYNTTEPDSRRTGPLPKGPTDPPRPGRRRPLLLMIVGGVAVVVIVVAGVVLLNRHPGKAAADAGATVRPTHAATRPTPKASPTPNIAQLQATPEGKAAISLAGLLQQAVLQLGNMPGAIADVRDCADLQPARLTFADAVGDRGRLLSELATMKGRSALPSAMMRDLTNGWQESIQEYKSLGRWVNEAIVSGCKKTTITSSSNYHDAEGQGSKAAQDKTAFVLLWDPIAGEYRQPTFRSTLL
jgi:hypothetical protein